VWDWASTCGPDDEPDIVLACAGDVPTQEALAAVELLAEHVPDLRVRFVNVVDLMALLPENDHPHGYSDATFDGLFTADKHVVFAFHGYPRAVHQLIHGRSEPGRFHVRGFNEQGTTTTPFDMVVLNRMSRFHLALEVLRRTERRAVGWQALTELCERRLAEHRPYIEEHLEDLPDIAEWTWRGLAGHAATDGPGR
jgi:xylulose-5-phosphate/fructose-6-phosphate phosphoketolase